MTPDRAALTAELVGELADWAEYCDRPRIAGRLREACELCRILADQMTVDGPDTADEARRLHPSSGDDAPPSGIPRPTLY